MSSRLPSSQLILYPKRYRHATDKIIWNTKHLHYTGVHGGGSCSAQGRDWNEPAGDWRVLDKVTAGDEHTDTPSQYTLKYVYHIEREQEGVIFHYFNAARERVGNPDSKRSEWIWDNSMVDLYWNTIERVLLDNRLPPSYEEDSPLSCCVATQYID